MPWNIFSGLLGGMLNFGSTIATNTHNERLIDKQNKAAKQEAELAYQRSKPTNQVNNLMQAGMSRAGALNAINGGGSYTPAPVNTAQADAPQFDTSSIVNAITANKEMQIQQKMMHKQMQMTREENEKNRETQKYVSDNARAAAEYSADSSSTTAGERLAWDKEVFNALKPMRARQLKELDARIKNLNAQEEQTKFNNRLLEMEVKLNEKYYSKQDLLLDLDYLITNNEMQLRKLQADNNLKFYQNLSERELQDFIAYRMQLETADMVLNAFKNSPELGTADLKIGLGKFLKLFTNPSKPKAIKDFFTLDTSGY